MVGQPQDAETITRAWEAVTDQPLGISMIPLDRSEPEGGAAAVLAAAGQTDVLILPLGILAEAIRKELVAPLSSPEFDAADEAIGEIVSAVDGLIALGTFGQPHKDGACDHDGQCVLLSVWHTTGLAMRRMLDSYTLADVAAMARGELAWPQVDLGVS